MSVLKCEHPDAYRVGGGLYCPKCKIVIDMFINQNESVRPRPQGLPDGKGDARRRASRGN